MIKSRNYLQIKSTIEIYNKTFAVVIREVIQNNFIIIQVLD